MARRSNTEERQAQIVDGLLAVMSERGYEHATIQAIGRAAGLTPGLIHYHFETKQEILVALVRTLTRRLEERYRVRLLAARTESGRLDAFIDAHLALGRDADPRTVAAWNVIGAEAVREPEVRRLYRSVMAKTLSEMRSLVRACLRAERRSTRDAGKIAAVLVSAIEGAYRMASAAPRSLPRGYAAPMVRRAAATLISAQGADQKELP